MYQVVFRRFSHYKDETPSFEAMPDLVLIDGGQKHALVACDALRALDLTACVLGMVKDDRHRTKALVTAEGQTVRIDSQPAVFSFIGSIQEETHRFAVTYHRQLRSKRLRKSELDGIPGIGPKRKTDLLKHFRSIKGIKNATLLELKRVLPADAALAVYNHFKIDPAEE